MGFTALPESGASNDPALQRPRIHTGDHLRLGAFDQIFDPQFTGCVVNDVLFLLSKKKA